MTWTAILLIIGLLILAVMAGYSVYLFAQLRKQKHLFEQARLARAARIKESIDIIARAMQAGECNLSEGVIRLKMLLDPLGQKRLSDYPAMWTLFETVQDMATHDERKALSKQERRSQDRLRESKETELDAQIKAETQQLSDDIK